MSFMTAVITDKTWWWSVDTEDNGTVFLPCNVCTEEDALIEASGDRGKIERVFGYGVQSTAPGYLDCTPWAVYSSKREALRAYREEAEAC